LALVGGAAAAQVSLLLQLLLLLSLPFLATCPACPFFLPPCSDEKWMHEPAVAGLLREEQGMDGNGTSGSSGGGGAAGSAAKWRRRRPRWLVGEKVYLNMEWRASQVGDDVAVSLLCCCSVVAVSPLLPRLPRPACPAETMACLPAHSPPPCCCPLYFVVSAQLAYRWWASLQTPAPTLAQVPPLAVQLVQQGMRFVTHSYPVRTLLCSLRCWQYLLCCCRPCARTLLLPVLRALPPPGWRS
jgi:hypothetical protein